MSGGVDSSVAAALLKESGCEVTGVFMCLGSEGAGDDSRGCCSPADAADARRVAQTLGIDMFVLNLQKEFAPIIDYFVAEYAAGRTPNPCIHCNTVLKFGRLIEYADSLGIDKVVTGHHARIMDCDGQAAICRAIDVKKDQSYALFGIAKSNLSRIVLPIGEIADKRRVRQIARQMGLNVHDKPDSQEICFVADDDYVAFLAAKAPHALRGGEIVDSAGKVLGEHDGYARFTIGQRRGLRIAAGEPRYVTHIDPVTARVTIGPREEIMTRSCAAAGAKWHCSVEDEFDAIVQIRYNHAGAPGRVKLTSPSSFTVEFAQDVSAVTPGQAAVIYDGDRLLGGGWID